LGSFGWGVLFVRGVLVGGVLVGWGVLVIACQTIAALGRLMLTAGDPAPLAAHLSQH